MKKEIFECIKVERTKTQSVIQLQVVDNNKQIAVIQFATIDQDAANSFVPGHHYEVAIAEVFDYIKK